MLDFKRSIKIKMAVDLQRMAMTDSGGARVKRGKA